MIFAAVDACLSIIYKPISFESCNLTGHAIGFHNSKTICTGILRSGADLASEKRADSGISSSENIDSAASRWLIEIVGSHPSACDSERTGGAIREQSSKRTAECGTAGCDIAGYCSDVAVTTTCILPLLSTESEVKTTVGLPTGINTMECHLFWRMTGW
jgi:hypothetical protein